MDEPALNFEGVTLSPQKELVRIFNKEMWDHADKKLIPTIFHPDFTFRGSLGPSLVGYDQFTGYVDRVTGAFGNYTTGETSRASVASIGKPLRLGSEPRPDLPGSSGKSLFLAGRDDAARPLRQGLRVRRCNSTALKYCSFAVAGPQLDAFDGSDKLAAHRFFRLYSGEWLVANLRRGVLSESIDR